MEELLYSREEPSVEKGVDEQNHNGDDESVACKLVLSPNACNNEYAVTCDNKNKREFIKPAIVSLSMYRFLCEHIVGSVETVRTKRLFTVIKDKLHYDEKLANITSGSLGEGLELRGSDRDIVVVYKILHVFHNLNSVPQHLRHCSFYIDVDDTWPGYAKLCLIDICNVSLRKKSLKIGTKYYLSNELFKKYFNFACSVKEISTPHGPSLSDKKGAYDFVPSLHCAEWIALCDKWKTRSKTAWPNNEVKSRILEHGVLFVPVGSKRSDNTNVEWRISFSVSEKLLVYSFNHTQLLAYALMKILLKDVINRTPRCEDILSSYYVKNVVFWLCEELNPQVWTPDNLIPCFLDILGRFAYCVEYLVCPHYFIPENNMFEDKFEKHERDALLERLNSLKNMEWRCILLSDQFNNFQISIRDISYQSDVTFNLIRHLLCSNVLVVDGVEFDASTTKQLYKRSIHTAVSHASAKVKSICSFFLSRLACNIGQWLQRPYEHQNKDTYRNYRLRLAYLLQSYYQDAVSGWLMMATFFYHHKQFKNAVEILKLVIANCSADKQYYQCKLTNHQIESAKYTACTKPTIAGMVKLHVVGTIDFLDKSLLIPKELGQDVQYTKCCFPPLVFGHFIAALCYTELHDEPNCLEHFENLIHTIKHKQFIGTPDKANALNCLETLLNVAGSTEKERKQIIAAACN